MAKIITVALFFVTLFLTTQAHKKYVNVMSLLINNALQEPYANVSTTCLKPDLAPVVCNAALSPGFTGLKTPEKRKVAYFFLFSYEVDILEVLLNENFDVVDKFFIVEAVVAQRKRRLKELVWERIKFEPRFYQFRSKIIHLVTDQARASVPEAEYNQIWAIENIMTVEGLKGFFRWQETAPAAEKFGPEDVFVSGDVDEVLSRDTVNQLAHCEFRGNIIASASWMPMGDLQRAFRTDWPVQGLPHTFASPTIYKVKVLDATTTVPHTGNVKTGARLLQPPDASAYVIGSMHMTSYSLPISVILKQVTNTEGGGFPSFENLDEFQDAAFKSHGNRCIPIDSLGEEKKIVYIPWFLRCNQERYPAWYGKHDPRNAKLQKEYAAFNALSRKTS